MPSLARVIRDRTAGSGSATSLAGWARKRRWAMLLRRFPDLHEMRVVDLGGTSQFWISAPTRPASVTLVNLTAPDPGLPAWIEGVSGDACSAGEDLDGMSFDLVFSNSTIEHIGGPARCQEFASSVRRLAAHHWVQTPYRYFPLEPHWMFPGFQFLPIAAQSRVAASWPLSHSRSRGEEIEDPVGAAISTSLLSKTELRYYFPAKRPSV